MPGNSKARKSRNVEIAPGLMKYGSTRASALRGEYHKLKLRKTVEKKKVEEVKKHIEHAIKKTNKKGQSYVVYTSEGVTPLYHAAPSAAQKTKTHKVGALRASITPGTVLILLAGKHRGARVVFLKRLDSGLLLVTGPFVINGTPLHRVDAAYVIATSTKIDISSVKIPEALNDAHFKKAREAKPAKTEAEFFKKDDKTAAKPKKVANPERIALQKNVDEQLLPLIKKVDSLQGYLTSNFSLGPHGLPHQMKF